MSKIERINSLTPMQEGMLFHSLLDEQGNHYKEQFTFYIEGELDIELLRRSWQLIVNKHEVFRMDFRWKESKVPIQILLKDKPCDFYYEDISALSNISCHTEQLKKHELNRQFDFENGKLNRIVVNKVGCEKYYICWTFHHILMDGWSVPIVMDDLLETYTRLLSNGAIETSRQAQFGSYLQWLEKQDKNSSMEYWAGYMANYSHKTPLIQMTHNRSIINKASKVTQSLSVDETKTLNNLCSEQMVTPSSFIQTALGVLLQKYNHTNTSCFGMTVSGRPPEIESVESIVGNFINTIPVVVKTDENMTIKDLIHEVHEHTIQSQSHDFISLADIEKLGPLGDDGLFDTLLIYQNFPLGQDVDDEEVNLKLIPDSIEELTNYDMTIEVSNQKALVIDFIYNGEKIDDEMVKTIADHLLHLIRTMILSIDQLVDDLHVLSDVAANFLLKLYEGEVVEHDEKKSILHYLVKHAGEYPKNVAYQDSNQEITFKDLMTKVYDLNHHIKNKRKPGHSVVGIMMNRSIEMAVSILAVWQSACAFVAIDPCESSTRALAIIEDASIDLLLIDGYANNQIIESFDGTILNVSDLKEKASSTSGNLFCGQEDLAYINYSFRKNQPYGVMVNHKSMMNHIYSKKEVTNLGKQSVVAQTSSFGYDLAIWQMFAGIMVGCKTVILDNATVIDPEKFIGSLGKNKVSHIQVQTSYLDTGLSFTNNLELSSLECVVTSGVVSSNIKEKWFKTFPEIKLIQAFGTSETSDSFAHCVLEKNLLQQTLGRPIMNASVIILDANLKICPPGVIGNIYVRGEPVAMGYHQRNNVTDQYFSKVGLNQISQFKTKYLGRYLLNEKIEVIELKHPAKSNQVISSRSPGSDLSVHVDVNPVSKEPSTQLEKDLTMIWSEILGKDQVGVNEDFFALGGHSLKAIRLISQMNRQLKTNYTLTDLLSKPTIEALLGNKDTVSSLVTLNKQNSLKKIFCVHGGGGAVSSFKVLANEFDNHTFIGIQAAGLIDEDHLHNNLEDMVSAYVSDVNEVNYQTPMVLMGYSFGSYIAYEMALQLEKQGVLLDKLILIDTPDISAIEDFDPYLKLEEMIIDLFEDPLNDLRELKSLNANEMLNEIYSNDKYSALEPFASIGHEQAQLIKNVIESNLKIELSIKEKIRENKLKGDIILINAQDGNPESNWSNWTDGQCVSQVIQGDHGSILEEPYVKELGSAIKVLVGL